MNRCERGRGDSGGRSRRARAMVRGKGGNEGDAHRRGDVGERRRGGGDVRRCERNRGGVVKRRKRGAGKKCYWESEKGQ